jgi:hypothetical protein
MSVRLRAVRSDRTAVRQELAGVVENHDAVAEKVPTLLGVPSDGDGCVAVGRVR